MQPIAMIAIATFTLGVGILFWFAFGGATATRKQMLANLRRQQEQPKTPAPTVTDQRQSGLSTLMRRGLPLPLVKTITRLWTGAGRPETT